MFTFSPRARAALLIVAGPISFVACGITSHAAESTSDATITLPVSVRAAKSAFVPTTADRAQADLKQLAKAVKRLDEYLTPGGANGAAWKKFLRWEQLSEQIERGTKADVETLESVHSRYVSGYEGLELAVFADVADALDSTINALSALNHPDLEGQFEAKLEALADAIARHESEPTIEALREIGETTDWLERAGQSPEVIATVRARFAQPNLLVRVTAPLLAAGIERPIDETAPVRDVIRGTTVRGTGRTEGHVSVALIPDPEKAVIETRLSATNNSRTTGYNGPALIYTRGKTSLEGVKRLMADADGVRSSPAKSEARTSTRFTGFGSTKNGFVGRFVERIAARKAPKEKYASERVAERHAERDLNERLDEEAGEFVERGNREFLDKFRNPLLRRDAFPAQLKLSTTSDFLQVVALADAPCCLGAPTAAPEILGEPDLVVRVHESLVGNFGARLLAGKTLDQDRVRELLIELLGEVPERFEDEEASETWSITFDEREPVLVQVDGQVVSLTIRGTRFEQDGKPKPAMHVTVRYRLDNDEGRLRLSRQGETEAFPPGFVPGGGERLGLQQTVFRNVLIKRFNKIFSDEILSEGMELPGEWSKLGTLSLGQLHADGGWLALGWERRSDATVAAPASPDTATTVSLDVE